MKYTFVYVKNNKIEFFAWENRNKRIQLCRKIQIQLPIKTLYLKKSTQNFIKGLPVVIKTSESNNLKRDPLEIQHPKFENSRFGLTVHER